jgi:hypothetical protein
MALYIPHGNYPKGKTFNIVSNNPRLFKDIEFKDFFDVLAIERNSDFTQSDLFLDSAKYQDNPMIGLIMLLSAIERTVSSTPQPLDGYLLSKAFKDKVKAATDGSQAYDIFKREIELYGKSHGSARAVVNFYSQNLSRDQRIDLVSGFFLAHKYKKVKPPAESEFVAIYVPTHDSSAAFDPKSDASTDEALAKRIRSVVYDIRNGFVHRSRWIPFGDEKVMEQMGVYQHERFENGIPKDTWLINMTFKKLHALTREAFQNYWLKEYEQNRKNRD